MKKIPTMFERVYGNHKVVDILPNFTSPDAMYALHHGIATVKVDGSLDALQAVAEECEQLAKENDGYYARKKMMDRASQITGIEITPVHEEEMRQARIENEANGIFFETDEPDGQCSNAFLQMHAVSEAPHGYWKYGTRAAVCSQCGFERHLDDNFGAAIACPNCGVRMDGEMNAE